MFYIGTKIVVIGSNVKRRAGPRPGSIGFIISMMYNQNLLKYIDEGNFIVCNAIVLFTKYGFQKQERFEVKNVYFIIPNIRKINTQKITTRTLQKDINSIKRYLTTNDLVKTTLLVSPADNQDNTCIIGKVFSCLSNNKIRVKIDCILKGVSSENFPNTERFQGTLSKEAKNFLASFLNCSNINSINYLINKTDKVVLNEILYLVVKLDSLDIIFERTSGIPKKIMDTEVQMFDSLFKPFDFKTKTIIWRKYVPLSIIEYCEKLRNFLCNEGNKILQKHI